MGNNPYKDAQKAAKEASPKVDRLIESQLASPSPRAIISENSNLMYPVWSIKRMDLDGPWGWRTLAKDHLWELHERLVGLEKMTWGEIDNAKDKTKRHLYHKIPVDNLERVAKRRLADLPNMRAAEIHRFAICSAKRLWGFRIAHVFEVLWFDPNHEVCKSTF